MKKLILFIITILFIFSLVLFVNVNDLNEEEILYEEIMPPDMILTDGQNSIISSPVIEDWYFRGKDNKYHPILYGEQNKINKMNSLDDKKTAGTGDNQESNIIRNTNKTSDTLLNYTGILKLKSICDPDSVSFQIFEYDTAGAIIFEDNNLKFEKSSAEDNLWECSLIQPKEDGRFIYRITAVWNKPEVSNDNSNIKSNSNSNIDASSNTNFCGKATYEFAFINDVPVEFNVSSTQTHPGEVITVFAKYANENENITLNSKLLQSELPFYSYEQGKFAILPLSYTLTPSDYIINLQVEETNSDAVDTISSRKSTYDMTISVLPKDFPIQHLTISSQVQQSTQSDAAYEEYDKYVGAVRKTNTPAKMWDGVFLQPVEGRITTEFGMRRFVNNAPTSYRHSGIDIAADKGVPVKATNSGKIILARHLILTGNTVLIDHGYGVISWSYHMDTLAVNEGDEVEKGQIIGTVGSTGFSTGPHLHFAISVHDVFANPWTFFKQEPVVFE